MKFNQKQKVLRHLKSIGSINPLDALKEYSIMRLAAVIYDLKDEGYDIKTDIVKSRNRFGEKVSFAKYTLVK
jgi:hypothetical protein